MPGLTAVLAALWLFPVADPAQLYREGRYAEAEAAWVEQLQRLDVDRVAVLANLGQCALRQGRHALAIARWTEARQVAPDDPVLIERIREARRTLGIVDRGDGSSLDRWIFAMRQGPPIARFAPALGLSAVGLLLVFGARRRPGRLALGFGCIALSSAGWLGVHLAPGELSEEVAIVREAGAAAFLDPHLTAGTTARLRAGETVSVLERSERWARVRAAERTLWVTSESLWLVPANQ